MRASLDASRSTRASALQERVVDFVRAHKQLVRRVPPLELADSSLEHVMSLSEAIALRQGRVLVIDPAPPLLSRSEMADAMADFASCVKGGYAMASTISCNTGAFQCLLPLDDGPDGSHTALRQPARTLLRKLGALPALVARAGWPRPLAVPQVAQLGYYPPGVAYAPHLDRPPHELQNKKELTFLIYVNVGWDAARCGGHLRVHPASSQDLARLPLLPQQSFDVDPIAGRLVVFQAGHVPHEVRPCHQTNQGRLALTLWIEYEDT